MEIHTQKNKGIYKKKVIRSKFGFNEGSLSRQPKYKPQNPTQNQDKAKMLFPVSREMIKGR